MIIKKINNLSAAVAYLSQELPTTGDITFRGGEGLQRAKQFFNTLGNPQNKLRAIHIAATSGKGTTATLISSILKTAGFKVGMSLSPHVYDIRERLQINNRLLPEDKFCQYLSQIIPVIDKLQSQGINPTYFEVLVGLAFWAFAAERVDYAVIETGLGGLLDATNTISRPDKLCVLGRIGNDHAEVLGDSEEKIAAQKAGIIQAKNSVIALKQSASINKVFAQQSHLQGSTLQWVDPAAALRNLRHHNLTELNDHLWGNFQSENLGLAITALRQLSARDGWQLTAQQIQAGIQQADLPGRFEEQRTKNKIIILDGAHNQQKIDAVQSAVGQKYPNRPYGMVLAMRATKAIPNLRAPALVITTSFSGTTQDMPIQAKPPQELAAALKAINPQLKLVVAPTLKEALQLIVSSQLNLWLITGSFFTLDEVHQILKLPQ